MQDTTRRHAIKLQLNDTEYETVRAQAAAEALSLAGFVRRAAIRYANAERRSEPF
jgi:hypothetical protein